MTLDTILLGIAVDLWLKLISLLGAAIAWLLANRRRPRLEAFFTHGAAHQIQGAQGTPPVVIHTHSLVVRNSGRAPALNVRVTHSLYPTDTTIQVWPQIPHTFIPNPPNGAEILFERLRPNEQIVVSYLYGSHTNAAQFGTHVRFDEGTAKFFPIQHVRAIPRWARLIVYYLLTGGLVLSIYLVLKAFLFIFVIA